MMAAVKVEMTVEKSVVSMDHVKVVMMAVLKVG
jgi:hypothetical protein